MKLNKIFIEEDITSQKGISQIHLERLNNVIALIGKNGSGKTRFLNLIEENLTEIISINHFLDDSITNPPKFFQPILKQLLEHKEYLLLREQIIIHNQKKKNNPENQSLKLKLDDMQNQFNSYHRKYTTNQNIPNIRQTGLQSLNILLEKAEAGIQRIRNNYVRRIKHQDVILLQDAISENKNNPIQLFDNLIENVAENIDYNVFSSINKSSLNFLKKLPHQLAYDYMDCMGDSNKYEKRISYKRYMLLRKLFEDFLSKDLTWESKTSDKKLTDQGVQSIQSGIWKLDGRLFDYNELSDGEKTLLSYILLFFLIDQNPNLNVSENIIIIDEPELHLHPNSEIELIEGIRKTISKNGQLIIATHSINILSNLNLDEIFMVKKGVVSHPSRKSPGQTLTELMSIEERIIKLKEFISITSEWSYINFMNQCFFEPEVVAHSSKDDPQYISFKKTINAITKNKYNLLLDFGAGKGRFYECLKDDVKFESKFEYSALEPSKQYHQDLNNLGINHIYQSHKELINSSFDFIVLCNVLHEIPITEWITVLNSITNALKDTGYLLIIEDKLLPKGEKIGEVGFLILDEDSLTELFGLNQSPISFVEESKTNRILCYVAQKNQIKKINKIKLLNALNRLKENSLIQIKELRKGKGKEMEVSYGRLNGFYSQQYINSILAIEHINNMN